MFLQMDLNAIMDKSHRILGEVHGLEGDVEELGTELDELQATVQELHIAADQKTTGLVQMVAVSQTNQVGVFIGLGLLGGLLLVVGVLLCALLKRMKKLKVGIISPRMWDKLNTLVFAARRSLPRHRLAGRCSPRGSGS